MRPTLVLLSAMALTACSGDGAPPAPRADEGPARYFVTVTAEAPQARGMAMVLSRQLVARSAEVRVLLCGPGGELGLRDAEGPTLQPAGASPEQMLRALIADGAQVEVCAIFLPNTRWSEADLVDGVTVARPADIAEHMLEPGVRFLTF